MPQILKNWNYSKTTIEKSSNNGFSILHFITQTLKIMCKDQRFNVYVIK